MFSYPLLTRGQFWEVNVSTPRRRKCRGIQETQLSYGWTCSFHSSFLSEFNPCRTIGFQSKICIEYNGHDHSSGYLTSTFCLLIRWVQLLLLCSLRKMSSCHASGLHSFVWPSENWKWFPRSLLSQLKCYKLRLFTWSCKLRAINSSWVVHARCLHGRTMHPLFLSENATGNESREN